MAEFTEGPWRDGNEALLVRLNRAKPWAGTVFRVSEMSDESALVAMVFGASVEECVATACLIAAAPDLLKALALFVESEKMARDGRAPQGADELIELGDAALAKANPATNKGYEG